MHFLLVSGANAGNLSIPLYVRGKAVSDEKGEYAADGFKNALMTWEASSQQLNIAIAELLQRLK